MAADGRVAQRVRAGYAVPLDTLAVDPRGYAATLPEAQRGAFAKLRPGRAILSATSARLRKVGAGGVLRLAGGRRLRVVAVVDDAALRDAELALASRDRRVEALRSTVMVLLREPVRPGELLRRAERDAAARIVDGAGPAGPARPIQMKVGVRRAGGRPARTATTGSGSTPSSCAATSSPARRRSSAASPATGR